MLSAAWEESVVRRKGLDLLASGHDGLTMKDVKWRGRICTGSGKEGEPGFWPWPDRSILVMPTTMRQKNLVPGQKSCSQF